MKHIKSINEFFGPFKKSEDDRIANGFLKRLSKVTSENNPYTVKKLSHADIIQLRDGGHEVKILMPYKVYTVEFDDVELIVCGYNDPPKALHPFTIKKPYNFHGEIYVRSHDDQDIDEIKCDNPIKGKIYNLMVKIYNNDDGKTKERLSRLKKNINPAADLL